MAGDWSDFPVHEKGFNDGEFVFCKVSMVLYIYIWTETIIIRRIIPVVLPWVIIMKHIIVIRLGYYVRPCASDR